MNLLPKKIRRFILLPLLGVLLTISLLILASFLVQRPSVQDYLIEKISDAIGYDITTGEIDLSLWRGIGISVYDLEAKSRQGFEKVNATRVKISLNAGQLLRGRIVPARMYLFQPWIELDILGEKGPSQAAKPPKTAPRGLFWIPGIKSIVVDKGYLRIKNIPFSFHDLKLDAHPRDPGS